MDIVYQLVNGLSGLPAQESRLARFFLDNFAQIPEASIEELAAKAGVSPATLQHFSRSIGCADLNDFIGQVRHQQQENRLKTTAAPMLGDAAWVDTYRHLHPQGTDYTWWSNRGAAFAKNVGWRIDYQLCTPSLRDKIRACSIAREPRFSDHAPFTVDYDL